MVASFGGRRQEPAVAGPVMLPPVQMPSVTVPVVLVVDVESLAYASEQLSQMVYEAVRSGFERAARDLEDESTDADGEPADG